MDLENTISVNSQMRTGECGNMISVNSQMRTGEFGKYDIGKFTDENW